MALQSGHYKVAIINYEKEMSHCAAFDCDYQSKGKKRVDFSLHSFLVNRKRRKKQESPGGVRLVVFDALV